MIKHFCDRCDTLIDNIYLLKMPVPTESFVGGDRIPYIELKELELCENCYKDMLNCFLKK